MPILTAVFLAAISGAAFSSDGSANRVGGVETVERTAFGTVPSAAKSRKREGSLVASQELLETNDRSGMLVRFADGSRLTLGADSRLRVDDFVYDPAKTGGRPPIR